VQLKLIQFITVTATGGHLAADFQQPFNKGPSDTFAATGNCYNLIAKIVHNQWVKIRVQSLQTLSSMADKYFLTVG
jgi:hypothetical protein